MSPPQDIGDQALLGAAIPEIDTGLAIAGSHGYNFGGTTSLGQTIKITEQELGTETTGSNKSDLLDINTRGSNAQTSSVIVAMGGTGTGGVRAKDIQEYSIGTTSNAVFKGNLNQTPDQTWTHAYSTTHAYTLGGWYFDGTNYPTDQIEEFEFGTTTGASFKSNLEIAVGANTGGTDGTYAYSMGGTAYSGGYINGAWIFDYEMGTATEAADPNNMDGAVRLGVTTQNATVLYYGGGYVSGYIKIIKEFEMQAGTNASAKSNLKTDSATFSGCQTTTHGYTMGGTNGSASDEIEEYEFDTAVAAVGKGDMELPIVNQFAGGSGTP